MIQIELTEAEQALLREILEKHLADLGAEIHRTDALEFKEMLRLREAALSRLAAKLTQGRELTKGVT